MIPQTFNNWTNYTLNDCKISPTKDFAQKRVAVYQNSQNAENLKNYVTL
jgi:hypothetical protein